MKKSKVRKPRKLAVPLERIQFQSMLAKNPNYFGNLTGSKLKPSLKLINKTTYEQITCVGYNPSTEIMEATFSIKKPTGYSGSLCTHGSFEYVRFYLDFHDGLGFIDQGSVRVNVHNIPNTKDCAGKTIFPITYVASLKKKTPRFSICSKPVLPTLRAILSWSFDPPPNDPTYKPAWGNVMDCDVQLQPIFFYFPADQILQANLSNYFSIAASNPNLTLKQVSEISGVNPADFTPEKVSPNLVDFVKESKRLKVPAKRFAYKTVQKMIKYPGSEITIQSKAILTAAKINVSQLVDVFGQFKPVDKSKANVDFEELECVGLDYHKESLVATIKIKKNVGYSGSLCDPGSKEYISFWIDWDDKCQWKYLKTVELRVHDIKMKGDHLCYTVELPLDTKYHKKLCSRPNVIRVRGVLSWNTPPSTTDPNKLEFYGNRVDTHIQIKPGPVITPGTVIPLFNIIGGIDVAHVDDTTGLTKSGSFFAFNGLSVPTSAPFGGRIVLNGPSFPGYRYKIKVTNLDTGTVSYPSDKFTVVGHLPSAPWVQYTEQKVDAAGYYHFLHPDKNTLNVLARFTPGTNDQLRVELEVDTIPGVFGKTIQMDNVGPVVSLKVNDGGDCTHYKVGDTIKGNYFVFDKNIWRWTFNSTWSAPLSGTVNTPALPGTAFSIPTPANAHPCGHVTLWAEDKTIVNSQGVGFEARTTYNVCLREK